MNDKILQYLKQGISVFLVGKTNSGKTQYALNTLLPFLNQHLKVEYYKQCDEIPTSPQKKTYIVDEVELLVDRKFLEQEHPDENPYYLPEYLKKVEQWYSRLKTINKPCVYIVTRNENSEIKNLCETVQNCEWNNLPAVAIRGP